MKKLLLYGGRFLTLASLVFLILTFQKHFAEIPRFALNAMSVSGLLATIAFVMMCSGLGSYAWVVLMRGARIVLPFRLAYVILGKSQIRKYLPGNIFHYLARLTEGKRYGLATEPIILSTGVETLIAAGGMASAEVRRKYGL